ncbi:hypothetical protein CONCODRAFT_7283 [Conidiobolus coronatus NRRL 28638]|uniref:Mos1 transposase HTH domain-containing protein n=1 Tax=Conidiobolus coronatus (strain ATCC 28846 / CBS 209.66 / NRRL 28638) TaxID=796925 RepID=A0A137P5B5_CONC2|nr:hypothetical protein CONCODRAFT_7283 [Conidiobolus coronatus NRRL 28638]|eukprot:KXN70198.1 hypothetical protein CONCODRAFT_7283 [Conidiobolus coronatus NRRL 28638]
MDIKRNIKSAILELFNKGKSETEAYKELSKTHSSYKISEKAIRNWYEKFMSEDSNLNGQKEVSSEKNLTDEHLIELIRENPDLTLYQKDNFKFTDEFLIELINKNPHLNLEQLAKLAGTSSETIRYRIKQINSNGERVKYVKKKYRPDGFGGPNSKLTDEYLINLVNENPDLDLSGLSELAGCSRTTISRKIRLIKQSGKSINYVKKNKAKTEDELLINLIDEDSSLTHEEIGRLTDRSNYTISRRIKEINSSGEKVKYACKIYELKISDEFLINLINENPSLSMNELAKLAGVARSTISNRIIQINKGEKKVNYIDKRFQKSKPQTNEKSKNKTRE